MKLEKLCTEKRTEIIKAQAFTERVQKFFPSMMGTWKFPPGFSLECLRSYLRGGIGSARAVVVSFQRAVQDYNEHVAEQRGDGQVVAQQRARIFSDVVRQVAEKWDDPTIYIPPCPERADIVAELLERFPGRVQYRSNNGPWTKVDAEQDPPECQQFRLLLN